jgi:hypothetical protein
MMTPTLVVLAGMLTTNEDAAFVGFAMVGSLNNSLVGSPLLSVTLTAPAAACGSDTVMVVCRFWPTEALDTPSTPSDATPFVSEKLAFVARPVTDAVTV